VLGEKPLVDPVENLTRDLRRDDPDADRRERSVRLRERRGRDAERKDERGERRAQDVTSR